MQCNKVFESEHTIAFYDIKPLCPVHVIAIPKGKYVDASDFHKNAPHDQIIDFYTSIQKICDKLDIKEYRIVSNVGVKSGQCIFHYHVHILSGMQLGTFL